jgi:hypothetical protein
LNTVLVFIPRHALKQRALKLDGLAALVSRFIPPTLFQRPRQRDRIYTPWITFCAFLGQVLQRGESCRDAVRRVQAWHLAACSNTAVDDATGGYCQARSRLPIELLRTAFEKLVPRLDRRSRDQDRWLGRVVKVIDGGGISMPDTAANRRSIRMRVGNARDVVFPPDKWSGCSL